MKPLFRNSLTSLVALSIWCAMPVFAADPPKKNLPPDDAVKGQIRGNVPRYLKVENVETESLSADDGAVKMAFKARLLAQENLYIDDKPAADVPNVLTTLSQEFQSQIPAPLRYLKLTQKEGEKGNVYGTFTATRRLDQWNFTEVVLETGLDQFGKPRGSFPAEYLVGGTPDADAAKKRYDDALASLKKEGEEIRRKQAEQNLAVKKESEEAVRAFKQKLMEATAPGNIYEGVVSRDGSRQGIRMRFVEQNGSIIKCELVNPGQLNDQRLFVGEFSIPDKVEGPHLVLGPLSNKEYSDSWHLYTQEGSISLRLVNDSWIGEGIFNNHYTYTFKLTRQKQAANSGVRSIQPSNAGEGSPNSRQAPGNASAQPAASESAREIVFSRGLPTKAYRAESVADFAENLNRALEEAERRSGHKDLLGTSPEVQTALVEFNRSLLGQPLHYTGKFVKTSRFLMEKKIIIEMGPQTFIAVTPRVDEKENLTLLKPKDEVEIVGEYNSISKNLSDKWTLEINAGQIIAIKR